jgi:hypothetical protein
MEFDETFEWANKQREPVKSDQICFSTQSFFLSVAGIAVVIVAIILIFTSASSGQPVNNSEEREEEQTYENYEADVNEELIE